LQAQRKAGEKFVKATYSVSFRLALIITLIPLLTTLSVRLRADTGSCSGQAITLPFTDVMGNPFFCAIALAYFSGLTNGTTATTYSPTVTVTREQMAAFVGRTLDQSLKRGSRRAALGQFWSVSNPPLAGHLLIPPVNQVKSDGTDVYVAIGGENRVVRVAASGPLVGEGFSVNALSEHTGIEKAYGIVITPDFVYVTGRTNPGKLYIVIRGDRSRPGLSAASNLGAGPTGIAYDGARVWTANAEGNSVSIYHTVTRAVTTITGFNNPFGILFDGANIWVTNYGHTNGNTLVKLDSDGTTLQSVTVGQGPAFPMFDGTNIWVPNYNSNTISVVRAASGEVIATLVGNGLNLPNEIAFDGQRVMVTNNGGNSLSLWKATDLTPLGSLTDQPTPIGVCSDGQDFWVTLLLRDINRGIISRY
jgi:hypothetical protein